MKERKILIFFRKKKVDYYQDKCYTDLFFSITINLIFNIPHKFILMPNN